jgi:hypothetical protein
VERAGWHSPTRSSCAGGGSGPVRALVGGAPKRRALTGAWRCLPTGISGRAGGGGDVGAKGGAIAHLWPVFRRSAQANTDTRLRRPNPRAADLSLWRTQRRGVGA